MLQVEVVQLRGMNPQLLAGQAVPAGTQVGQTLTSQGGDAYLLLIICSLCSC
jgi:hypothetical protein